MAAATVPSMQAELSAGTTGHRVWVRICHWVTALSFVTLAVTGFLILMVHPRLYWGEVGNDLTPAWLEFPISHNHRPEGWEQTVTFSTLPSAPISANRTYEIFNQNGWGRSLHFLAGWFLVVTGLFYVVAGIVTGHVRRNLLPRLRDLAPRALWQDLKAHLGLQMGSVGAGAPYGLLQRCTYAGVALVVLPLMVLTGLSMSPTIAASYPLLRDLLGGQQSVRTVHFIGFAALVLFLLVHVAMVVLTGFRKQIRAMTLGN
jgi:thiosulfate reductase cytochrome b subunit